MMAAKGGFGPPRGLPRPRGFVARQGGLIRLEERPESRGDRAVEAEPRGGRAAEPWIQGRGGRAAWMQRGLQGRSGEDPRRAQG